MEVLDFLTTPAFKKVWDSVLYVIACITAFLTVFSYLFYAIRLFLQRTPKAKYDFILKSELGAIRMSIVCFSILVGAMVNLFGEEELNKTASTFFIHFGISVVLSGALMYLPMMYFRLYYPKIQAKKLNKCRYAPRINPANGNQMKLLSEEEEDVYLDPGMQAEEESFSVDYDVWIDESAGDTIIERYEGRLAALECINCGFQTLRLTSEDLIEADDSGRERLVKHYDCSFCKRHEEKTVYVTRDLEHIHVNIEKEVKKVRIEVIDKTEEVKPYEFSSIQQASNFIDEMKKRVITSKGGGDRKDEEKSSDGGK